jgi:hypothetical protein
VLLVGSCKVINALKKLLKAFRLHMRTQLRLQVEPVHNTRSSQQRSGSVGWE